MPVTDAILTAIIVGALLMFMVMPVVAAVFCLRVHVRDPRRPKLWLPLALARTLAAWSATTVYLGIIAIIRTIWGLAGVPAWTSGLTTLSVITMGASAAYLLASFLRNT
jgi:hypothetical protein